MAESAESAALRAAVAAASLLAVLTAVGDLLGDMPWPVDYEGVHFQYIVNLFDALAFVVGELAAEYVVPETYRANAPIPSAALPLLQPRPAPPLPVMFHSYEWNITPQPALRRRQSQGRPRGRSSSRRLIADASTGMRM